ncbi:MAG: hypothetical protein Hyperionvirus4_95 [Hyperionvirus sp.]|uniref:Ankyrin repeat domain-containing protein n=1 Tax=Hyperionvirus sp. TaxID=2487770 RepID=A0A3G5A790_9VIRU|nr:MAG: hypothetical protein Hyperionvirus4_95 [Hyperionvirus sp.]
MDESPLVFLCLKELIEHDDAKIDSINAFKKVEECNIYSSICEIGFEELECSLFALMCEAKELTTESFNFALKHELIKRNDIKFLAGYINNLRSSDQWGILYHFIRNFYDLERIKTMRTDSEGTSLLTYLVFLPCFNEGWFMVILHYLEQNGYDIKYKGATNRTLLDGAIYQRSVKLVNYLVSKGIKFSEGVRMAEKKGCDFVQWHIAFPYNYMDHSPCKDYQNACFEIVAACVKAGYDISLKDADGLNIKDYVEKYINKDKFLDSYAKHMELLGV